MPVPPIKFVEIFQGHHGPSAEEWIKNLEAAFLLENVPEEKRFLYVFNDLSATVKQCLLNATRPVEKISGRRWEWDWPSLKIVLRGIEKQIKKPSCSNTSWAKALTLGALVAVGGPVALGWAFAETAICALGVIALNRVDITGVKARAIAAEVGKSALPPVAHETTRQISSRPPSKSWADGSKFNPSLELVIELLKTMAPEKNTR